MEEKRIGLGGNGVMSRDPAIELDGGALSKS